MHPLDVLVSRVESYRGILEVQYSNGPRRKFDQSRMLLNSTCRKMNTSC